MLNAAQRKILKQQNGDDLENLGKGSKDGEGHRKKTNGAEFTQPTMLLPHSFQIFSPHSFFAL